MTDQELQVAEKQEIAPDRGEFTREGVFFTPAVDICETEKELILMADMPGVGTEDVEVDLKDGVLAIVGRVPSGTEAGQDLLTEYRTGNYFRTFRISDVVDQGKITASMSDGVLKLVLPKAEKAIPRRIPIAGE